MSKSGQVKKTILFWTLILLLSGTSLVAANVFFQISDTVYEGVRVGNIPVGGLNKQEAANRIRESFASGAVQTLQLASDEHGTWNIQAQDIALQIDPDALANAAYAIGRSGGIINRVKDRYIAANNQIILPLHAQYDREKLNEQLKAIAKRIERPPLNAYLSYENDRVKVTKEEIGYHINTSTLEGQIEQALKYTIPPLSIKLAADVVEPSIKAIDLQGIDDRLARYTTQFDLNDYNRQKNIALAAEKLAGVLIKPDGIFSFNELVGPRSAENGYLDAPVYINGKLAVDVGGGVCQVSTTIYNAALLADLEIEERSSHYRPPGYVPLGYDAAVAYGLLDLKFKNSMESPLYIAVSISASQLSVDIYGRRLPAGYETKIMAVDKRVVEPTVIIRQDEQLEFGREIIENDGACGYAVTLIRITSQDGKQIKREILSTDEFPVEEKIVRVGTKAYRGKK
ncbi:VanW family protein [Azotosporobacter soli]|uniref:VanW family protein n=1 Tax=Azotosporobacter soli TaxID=3055040 RepID=UPI0031FEAC3C